MGSLGQRDGLGGRGLRAAALGVLLLSTPAYAQSTPPPSPTAEARKEAARRYAEGTRAFDARDFTRAGEAFDAAYALAPHPDALWNSARAWHSAGELARAANLYARYLREARRDAPDRPGALAAQKQLASRLGRIEIHPGEGVQNVRVDDVPVEGTVVYVVPGVHVVRGRSGGAEPREVEQRAALEAGAEVSVLLAPSAPDAEAHPLPLSPTPPPPSAAPTQAQPVLPAPPPAAPRQRGGWSPVVVLVEGGITLALAGVTLWSALDTVSTLHAFEAKATQGTLDAGRSEEIRTNVLLGASIGLAAITGLTATFLVNWRGSGARGAEAVDLGFGPGSVVVRGSF
jgi:hypothetical protein